MRRSYQADRCEARQQVAAIGGHRITTPWGTIEYVDAGEGVPVFVCHGVLGGHDNIRDLVNLWFGAQYRAIGPSRFGYLGSTMPANATVADQADAYVALLDHLRLERVVLCGFSAGGPSAIQFALRHPERLVGLVLGSSYLPGMGARAVPPMLHPILRAVMGWERGWWLLKEFWPERLARIMGVPKGWASSGDPDFLAIRTCLFPIEPKRYGAVFDGFVSEPACNGFPLEEIDVPTLLVHAADDRLAPYEHVAPAAARIPGARLVTIQAGGHLFLAHQAEVRAATQGFIAEAASGTRPRSTPTSSRLRL